MSIPVTDKMVEAYCKSSNGPSWNSAGETYRAYERQEVREALTAALAVAGKDELTGALGAIYEIREATGVGGKPMLAELAEAIKAKQTEAIRAAVLAEREACANAWKTVGEFHPESIYGNAIEDFAAAIRSRPDPSEGA